MTFIAALRHDRIDASCVIDGPINGSIFQTFGTLLSFVEAKLAE